MGGGYSLHLIFNFILIHDSFIFYIAKFQIKISKVLKNVQRVARAGEGGGQGKHFKPTPAPGHQI